MTGTDVAISRPLRAIVMLLILWSCGRATYEFAPLIGVTPQASPAIARAITAEPVSAAPDSQFHLNPADISLPEPKAAVRTQRAIVARKRSSEPPLVVDGQAAQASPAPATQIAIDRLTRSADANVQAQPRPVKPLRLSLSSWLLVRDGAAGLAPSGTLGGSQIGARVYLPVTSIVAATARISAPLRSPGAEASVGVALRQGPVALLLERRIALERGARNDFSATLAAGVDDVRLPNQFRLDAYGQAGIVGRDGFADGAVRIERQIAAQGKTRIAVGAGLWGGAQPEIARLDTGPQIVVRTPIAGGHLRASGEWRQRIAGKAQPTSGPALTLGMDF